jgi:hypothetical protein
MRYILTVCLLLSVGALLGGCVFDPDWGWHHHHHDRY